MVWQKDHFSVLVDKCIYSESCLLKCFYWYGNEFSIEISDIDESTREVKVFPRHQLADTDLKQLRERIRNDLVDYRLQEIVNEETKNIRDLIVARAFASSDVYEDDPSSAPPTESSIV